MTSRAGVLSKTGLFCTSSTMTCSPVAASRTAGGLLRRDLSTNSRRSSSEPGMSHRLFEFQSAARVTTTRFADPACSDENRADGREREGVDQRRHAQTYPFSRRKPFTASRMPAATIGSVTGRHWSATGGYRRPTPAQSGGYARGWPRRMCILSRGKPVQRLRLCRTVCARKSAHIIRRTLPEQPRDCLCAGCGIPRAGRFGPNGAAACRAIRFAGCASAPNAAWASSSDEVWTALLSPATARCFVRVATSPESRTREGHASAYLVAPCAPAPSGSGDGRACRRGHHPIARRRRHQPMLARRRHAVEPSAHALSPESPRPPTTSRPE